MAKTYPPLEFLINDKIYPDLKGYILSFVPYEYKTAIIDAFETWNSTNTPLDGYGNFIPDEKFVEKHIHHYEPHRFQWEEYDMLLKIKSYEYPMINGQKDGLHIEYDDDGFAFIGAEYVRGVKHGIMWEEFENHSYN